MLRARFIAFSWLGAMGAWVLGESLGGGQLPELRALAVGAPIVLLVAIAASGPVFSRLASVLKLAREIDEFSSNASAPAGDELAQLRRLLLDVQKRYAETSRMLVSEQNVSARILDGMAEGVLLLDSQHRVLLCNPALRELLLLRSDVVGKPVLEVLRHAELAELIAQVAPEHSPSCELELRGLLPQRVAVRASALRGGGGGVLLVVSDVTAMRQLERMRRDFVANVSHELRTPVTSVLSGAETLRLVLAEHPERAAPFVDIIERNAERLRLLIEDLLDLSKIESKSLQLKPERVHARGVLEHIVSLFRERAAKRHITTQVIAEEDLYFSADRRAVEQVLTNLVDNAVKYTNDGGTVTVSADAIDGAATQSQGTIALRVHDDGPGIPPKHLPRLFERFYRADKGRAREQGGTGLGLAIAKHLVEAMHGTLGVHSEDGQGTTFEVLLPRSTSTPERSAGPPGLRVSVRPRHHHTPRS